MTRSIATCMASGSPHDCVWENVRGQVVPTRDGYVLFDDTVLDKNYSFAIELVRAQYSGNAKAVIKGIGVVTCVYVHPDTDQFWLIDYRIYDPDGDGKSKLDHVREMLTNVVYQKHLPFQAVLMDTWYATKDFMLFIETLRKNYYCPLKDNRQVDDSGRQQPYRRVDALRLERPGLGPRQDGSRSKAFPKTTRCNCSGLRCLPTARTMSSPTTDSGFHGGHTKACGFRWKIEQLHREGKQVTGLERCQCRKARIQRNHIGCAFLVWVRLKELATHTGRTIYQLKHGLLDDYLIQQLKKPSLQMALA